MKKFVPLAFMIWVCVSCHKQEAGQVNRFPSVTDTILPFNSNFPLVANWVLQSSNDGLGYVRIYPQDGIGGNVITWASHLILFENNAFTFTFYGEGANPPYGFSGDYSYINNRLIMPASLTKPQTQVTSSYHVNYLVPDTLILNDSTYLSTNYVYVRKK